MPWFKCSICGENFPGVLFGSSEEYGFYVTRFVEAGSADEAELLALENLKSEEKLRLPTGTPKPTNARVLFEKIVEVEKDEVPETPAGFCFFKMGS